jgi:hypothetical protein
MTTLRDYQALAAHEVGHALVGIHACSASVDRLELATGASSIHIDAPPYLAAGVCRYTDSGTDAGLIAQVARLLAGEENDMLYRGCREAARVGGTGDAMRVEALIFDARMRRAMSRRPLTPDVVDAIMRQARLVAVSILATPQCQRASRLIARDLLVDGCVDGARVHRVATRHRPPDALLDAVRAITVT